MRTKILILATASAVCLAQSVLSGDAKSNIVEVKFTAKIDKTEQYYVVIYPERYSKGKSYDALIALHGHGSDRWQFAKGDRAECKAAREVAAERKMIFVSPDYRAKTSWMGPKAEADVEQIISELKKRNKVGRVFICGASMGGASCLTFTALHPELIDGVASMNGTANHVEYNNFQDAISESFGGSKETIPDEYKKRSAEFCPEKFTMPVGITASGKDGPVPPQSVLRLADKLKAQNSDKVLLVYREEAGHATNLEDAKAILNFVIDKSKPTSSKK